MSETTKTVKKLHLKTTKKRFVRGEEGGEGRGWEHENTYRKRIRKRVGNETKTFVLTKDLPWLHFTLPPLPSARLLSPKMGGVEIKKQLDG